MELKIDQQADALHLARSEAPASRSGEISGGIVVDYDDQDRVAGIEMLYPARRAPKADFQRLLFETIPKKRMDPLKKPLEHAVQKALLAEPRARARPVPAHCSPSVS